MAAGIICRANSEWSKFDEKSVEAMKEQWRRDYGGATNYGSVAFTGDTIDFHRMNMSPADLRLGESELQSKRQIAAMFKVPTQLLNDAEGATFSNQAAAQKSVYTNTIIPEMRALGEGIATWLGEAYYPGAEIRIIPDTSGIEVLQIDKKELVSWLVQADWMTQNEKRVTMELEESTDPRMDDFLIPNAKTFSKDIDLLGNLNNAGSGGNNED